MAPVSDVALYLLHLDELKGGEGLSNLKLQKLAYYCQGFHLAIFDKPLFSEHIEAWTHGPVVPALYHAYKNHGSARIVEPAGCDIEKLSISAEERELMEEVYDVFGQYSAWALRDMTHEESPWLKHEASAGVIPTEDLTEYFKTRIQ
jgi:uncharacterized phage-associated protein